MISAKIICDSENCGNRLTTFVLQYPRFIHAELMTHRDFSRNTSSSRAIPVKKMIDNAKTIEPLYWGKNKSGMSAEEELDENNIVHAKEVWNNARFHAMFYAEKFNDLGVHKQIANRILEPFIPVTVIVSATRWSNFFSLRCDENAQPEMRELAFTMLKEYYNSTPKQLGRYEWHLPFISDDEKTKLKIDIQKKVSVARCARVSYLNHEGNADIKKDIDLHNRLAENGHWSAFEHIATPVTELDVCYYYSNFKGWIQYRKMFAGEVRDTMPTKEEVDKYFEGQK